MILWGPPGAGKTTLASLMASVTGARFVAFSAVLSGVKEIREVIAEAEREQGRRGIRTILFVDEIHRFNRAQQDAFLPHVEKGTVVLIGATTENPSFEVNSALLSRCRVYVLSALEDDDLLAIMRRALADGARGLAALRPGGDRRRAPLDRARGQRRRAGRAERARGRRRAGAGRRRSAARHRDVDPRGGAAPDASLRQVGRGALQPDLGAPQVAARLGSGRGTVLAHPDARGGRRPFVHRAAARPLRVRGRRQRRSRRALAHARGQGGLRLPRRSRRRAGARPGDPLSGAGARSRTRCTSPTTRQKRT